ncbi:choloylglycine hydrolase family protein [Levilactobacillus namurensis]|uniref:choloylglycine hydrolase family protein n=1 Tax=Levilactobacillus namurensis TaxID=380393 RepID=UPI002231B15E|nr:choloylglycine hydrolase family protein [Levilactobacillus namurensis]MCW3778786.1 choloylglycine hydrolase family protein [Levilactobacillus namurensis]MDT7019359.1 choloylglycine hydrolase family protein [Levilactobacillus namurensis]WNN66044.1 choloylglycine hydrolase family protein [Levilactobacillus namurensis]
MCTSLTYQNSRGDHFLARTMDFAFELHGQPMFMPRNWRVAGDAGEFTTTYGFVGAGRKIGHEMFVDGVNEKGLGVAALYFPENAQYVDPDQVPAGKQAIAPHDFVAWALGNAASVADLRELVTHIQLVNLPVSLLKLITPLHYIISDPTGETAVLEATSQDLKLIEDSVGVMTNSPDLGWHLQNLSTYGTLTATEQPLHDYLGYQLKTQGPGTGALGLPGDYTSPSRFVRTVFAKHFSQPTADVPSTLNLLQHLLDSVTIPKGVKLKADGGDDYTQYRGYMSLEERAYYMEPYDNFELQRVVLTTEMLEEQHTPVNYALQPSVHIQNLN